MKQILFWAAFLLLVFSATAQEEVLNETVYLPYQDSLLITKTTVIVNTGLEGLNDTIVTYSSPIDSMNLAANQYSDFSGSIKRAAARWRANWGFRTILQEYQQTSANLASLGLDIDSVAVSKYSSPFKGRYLFNEDDGTQYFVNIDDHPTRSDILLGIREDGGANITVTIFSRWLIRVRYGAQDLEYLLWDGLNASRATFRHESANTPAAMTTKNNRWIRKVR